MSGLVTEVKVPLVETDDGDFQIVQGDAMVRQVVQLGFATEPGQFHDIEYWGAGIALELNKKPTSNALDEIKNRAARFLDLIPEIDGYEFSIRHEDSATYLDTTVAYDGQAVIVPGVKIA